MDLGLSPETVKLLPKSFKAKSTWGDFPKVAAGIGSASIRVSSVASDMDMGVSLAESADIAAKKLT